MSKTQNGGRQHNSFGITRREVLKVASATGAIGVSGLAHSASHEKGSAKLKIEMAGYDYDRVKPLIDGRVEIEGCTTNFEVSRIGDMNTHIFSGPQTRGVTEVGLHPFMLAYANEGFRDYSLLPVFPLRTFRHKNIYVRTDRGIETPEDLRGKKIATPGYSSTSLTWIRGILQDEYGVTPKDIQWVVSSEDSSAKISGGPSKLENMIPEGLSVVSGPAGKDESDLLESGEVDALFHAIQPRTYVEGHLNVARLFRDSRSVEQAYFSKTGIFPIMHAVAIRNDLLESHPWLAESVFSAYSQAKQLTYDFFTKAAWADIALPWISQEIEDTRELMGKNFWPYGIEASRSSLEALFRYSHEQGFSSRELQIEELFHPLGLQLAESPG